MVIRNGNLAKSFKNYKFLLHIFIIICHIATSDANWREKRVFTISIFYDETYDNVEDVTAYSADIIDRFLKSSMFRFEYKIHPTYINNSYKLTRLLCTELYEGRLAIITIGSSPIFEQLKLIANSLEIPYIAIKWDNKNKYNTVLEPPSNKITKTYPFELNIHPPASKLMTSIIDLIKMYKWDFVTILYQETTGPERIQEFIRLPSTILMHNKKFRLQVRQLSTDMNKWIYLIKDIKLSGSSHIIVDIENKNLNSFIRISDEVGLMTSYFHIIFTTLDLSVIDVSPSANITALQLHEPNNSRINNIHAEFNLKNMVANKPMTRYLPSIATLIYDALLLLANTIDRHNLVDILPLSFSVSCESETKWDFGNKFNTYLRMSKINGLTGNIEFDPVTGFRRNLSFNIVDLTRNGLSLVGKWIEKEAPAKNKIEILRSYEKEKIQVDNKLNRHLIVTSKIEAPYVMLKPKNHNDTLFGNDKYIGFCVQMLDKIASICNFNYTIKMVDDGFHGALVNGKWNGIVSELIDKKADLAVAALTINYQREQAIDFTKPFLNLGISILYKRPQKKTPNLFSFLSPLSIEIWLYMIAAYLVVSFMLFVIARFSPYEWRNPHPCNRSSELVENQFTIMNSLWFTIGSLMQQGTDLNPHAPSVRVISCAWAFFTLILISSYTANLAAFLTVKRMQTPIENVEDLARQTEIKYGPVLGGSTQNFFKESKIQTYEKMWNFMNSNPDNFVKSTDEAIARIRKGNYAYLVESTTNEYMKQRDCDLMQIGGLLDTKGYGIATPSGSPWRDKISNAVLKMHENGDIQELYSNWWKKYGIPDTKCENSDVQKDSANELSFENVGGVFVVLAFGLSLALIVALLEFTWKAKQASHEQISFSNRFKKGFGNILSNFCQSEFINTFPKLNLNRIIHHQHRAANLNHMVSELQQAQTSRQQYSKPIHQELAEDDEINLKKHDFEKLERRRHKRLRKQQLIKSQTHMYLDEKSNVATRRNIACPASNELQKRSKSNESNILFLPY